MIVYLVLSTTKTMNTTSFSEFEIFQSINNVVFSLKIIHGIIFCFAELITFICYSGFVYYEHYGGDPMKRSIKNKFLSQMSISIIIQFCVSTPSFAWRIIIGPLNAKVS